MTEALRPEAHEPRTSVVLTYTKDDQTNSLTARIGDVLRLDGRYSPRLYSIREIMDEPVRTGNGSEVTGFWLSYLENPGGVIRPEEFWLGPKKTTPEGEILFQATEASVVHALKSKSVEESAR